MRSVLVYTGARLLLFLAALGLVYLVGARGLLAVAIAVLVSGLASYVLLSRQRDAMSGRIVAGARGLSSRLDAGAQAEDEDSEDSDAESSGAAPPVDTVDTVDTGGAAPRLRRRRAGQ